MNGLAEYRNNLQLFYNYNDVAKSYGLFSKQITVPNPAGRPDVYLVISVNPIKDDVNPVEIINKTNRNTNLFYPESFAVSLCDENPLLIWDKASHYLASAELLSKLYEQFETPLPKSIRVSELQGLSRFYFGKHNPRLDVETRNDYAKGLEEFFEKEQPSNKLSKEWQSFYRSELYDEDKSVVRNLLAFLKRDEPETEIDVLLESNYDLKKVYVPEHYYKKFRDVIVAQYPEVKYHVSEKKVVDEGIIVDPDTKEAISTQFGKCVTEEEYDKICEERFAVDGFNCLDGLTPSYFEGRDVVYKASDENIIASVLNDISFRWAKCPSLASLQERGRLEKVDIPYRQMKNFYATMKQYDVPFYIDNDVNRKPNFDAIHVLYNACDHDKVVNIVTGLVIVDMTLSHADIPEETSFFVDIDKVDDLIIDARKKAHRNNIEARNTQVLKSPVDKTIEI